MHTYSEVTDFSTIPYNSVKYAQSEYHFQSTETVYLMTSLVPPSHKSLKGKAKYPATCAAAMKNKKINPKTRKKKGAQYTLQVPGSGMPPFRVYCWKSSAKRRAWTVIQRRMDNSTEFYRDWQVYKKGFGDIGREYFIGLDNLHAMTHAKINELWISMTDFEGHRAQAKYDRLEIGSEEEKYVLKGLGKYTGTAGDSLRNHVGMKFTTRDANNDISSSNCAEGYKGAWWYYNCYDSNLNGRYLLGQETAEQFGQGIQWRSFRANYSLKYVRMAIRPKKGY